MSFLRRATKQREVIEPFTNLTVPRFGYRSRAGVSVSVERGLRHAAVWACVRLRAETIAGLPVSVVERRGNDRVEVAPPAWLEKPNPEMSPFDLWEATSSSVDTRGNAFWWTERDRIGRIVEVWPMVPSAVMPFRDRTKPGMPKLYQVAGKVYGPDKVFHLKGFGLPGSMHGLSPIDQHVTSLGLSIAAESYGEAFFGNGAQMTGAIKIPNDPGEDAVTRMVNGFAADHTGLENAHKPGVLFGGAEWIQLTIPNEAAQFLETRQYQLDEICRIWRTPPHKIANLLRATFSNIEHQGIEWSTDGVAPYTNRFQSAVVAAGLLDSPSHRLKFNLRGLVQGDLMTRYASYAIGRQWGWLSADDVRAFEDMNPLPDGVGQVYLSPLNMVPAGEEQADLMKRITSAGAIVRAGMDPTTALVAAGIDPVTAAQSLGLFEAEPQEAPA